MPAVARVLAEAGLAYADLGAIAVGVGPGTFTGLRIGVATARALGSSAGLQLRPVSSLAALAAGIDAEPTLAVIDARRGEVFAALYEGAEELLARGARARRSWRDAWRKAAGAAGGRGWGGTIQERLRGGGHAGCPGRLAGARGPRALHLPAGARCSSRRSAGRPPGLSQRAGRQQP